MEMWHIDNDGNGNYTIYPAYVLAGGTLALFVFIFIKSILGGFSDDVYRFACNYTWIFVLILSVISVIVAFIAGTYFEKHIHLSILFVGSLPLSLSLCYSETIDCLISWGEQLEEVFLVALFLSPVFFVILLLELAIIMILGLGVFIPFYFSKNSKEKPIFLATVTGLISCGILIYWINSSNLPEYLMRSLPF